MKDAENSFEIEIFCGFCSLKTRSCAYQVAIFDLRAYVSHQVSQLKSAEMEVSRFFKALDLSLFSLICLAYYYDRIINFLIRSKGAETIDNIS